MRTTRSLRVSDEAWAELERRAGVAGVAGRGEYLEWLVSGERQDAPVVVSDDTKHTSIPMRSFEEAWDSLDEDGQRSLKWSQLALRAFYDAVVEA